jgi:hypothetical protein
LWERDREGERDRRKRGEVEIDEERVKWNVERR